jgi:ubiquinone/menaquinone biosynthesis C-methylase UbiE
MHRAEAIQRSSCDWNDYVRQYSGCLSSGLGGAQEFFEYEDMMQRRVLNEGFNKLNIDLNNLKVLDVGCGAGRITIEYFKKGAKVIGVDISKEMLYEAKDREKSIEYIKYDGINFPFKDGIFDIVNSTAILPVLESIGITGIVLREMVRVCKKNCYIICLELTPQKKGFIFSPNNYIDEHTTPLSAERFIDTFNAENCNLIFKKGIYILPIRFVYVHFKNVNPLFHFFLPAIIKVSKIFDLCFTKHMNDYSEKNLFIFKKLGVGGTQEFFEYKDMEKLV